MSLSFDEAYRLGNQKAAIHWQREAYRHMRRARTMLAYAAMRYIDAGDLRKGKAVTVQADQMMRQAKVACRKSKLEE